MFTIEIQYDTSCHDYVMQSLKKTVSRAIAAAVANLETALDTESFDSYTLAIVTYALTISNSSKAANALDKLNAIVINMGKFAFIY